MTPDQLKASILQLAIQGKLVPQRPEEGTAEELYQQIQREKKKLTAAGKLKKEKPLPPITKDEIPFDIPESWKWVRLGEIFEIVTGKTPSKSDIQNYTPAEVPFYKPADIGQASHIDAATQQVSEKGSWSAPVLPKGAILVNCIGNIGKCAIIDKEGICNQQINAVIPISAIALEYFLFVLRSDYAINNEKHSASATTIPILNKLKFSKICIPLPPLAEQQRIVEKIEQMLPLVEQYGEAYTALESLDARFPDDMRKSILQYAIQGKLVPQRPEDGTAEELYQQIQKEKKKLIATGKLKKEKPLPPISEEEIPFDIPDTWKWCRLGDFFTNATGLAYKKDALNVKSDNMTRVLRGGNIGEGTYTFKSDDVFIDSSFVNPSLYLKKGTLITPAVSSLEQIGKIALINQSYDNVVVGGFVLMLLPFLAEDILLMYLLAFFSSDHHRASCREITHKSGQAFYNLSRAKLMNLIVPLPPRAEQKRIVEKIEKCWHDMLNK